MGKYIDGYVLLVDKDKTEEYQKTAEQGRNLWMKHGALSYFECRGDDLVTRNMGAEFQSMEGKPREFPEMTGANPDEEVWYSFVIFESKQHRDEVNARVFEETDKIMAEHKEMSWPFDGKKMAYGGFEVVVEG